jgi:hypothetical protein
VAHFAASGSITLRQRRGNNASVAIIGKDRGNIGLPSGMVSVS